MPWSGLPLGFPCSLPRSFAGRDIFRRENDSALYRQLPESYCFLVPFGSFHP